MPIQVKLPTLLRKHAEGAAVVEASGATLDQLLGDLERRFPGLTARLRAEDGSLKRFVNVYVNEEDARLLGALQATLADGDTVTLVPAVAGG